MQHRQLLLLFSALGSHNNSSISAARTAQGANESKLPIEIAANNGVITKLYATLDPCFTSGFRIEHQCRRGL
jgi:hypothetical protein